jgi:hypothetical protein
MGIILIGIVIISLYLLTKNCSDSKYEEYLEIKKFEEE